MKNTSLSLLCWTVNPGHPSAYRPFFTDVTTFNQSGAGPAQTDTLAPQTPAVELTEQGRLECSLKPFSGLGAGQQGDAGPTTAKAGTRAVSAALRSGRHGPGNMRSYLEGT